MPDRFEEMAKKIVNRIIDNDTSQLNGSYHAVTQALRTIAKEARDEERERAARILESFRVPKPIVSDDVIFNETIDDMQAAIRSGEEGEK